MVHITHEALSASMVSTSLGAASPRWGGWGRERRAQWAFKKTILYAIGVNSVGIYLKASSKGKMEFRERENLGDIYIYR